MKKQQTLSSHPAADIFPLLEGKEFEAFKSDISENGLHDPIVLFDGRILDGRNRYRACCDLGLQARTTDFDGDDPVAFVVSKNLHRRQLTASQLGMVALEIEKVEAKLAKARQGSRSDLRNIPEEIPEGGDARDKAAQAVGVNPRYVSDAKRIAKEAPDLADRVRSGEMTMPRAVTTLNTRKRRKPDARKPNTGARSKRRSHADKTGESDSEREHRLALSQACYTLSNAKVSFEKFIDNTPPNHRGKLKEAAEAAKRWIK